VRKSNETVWTGASNSPFRLAVSIGNLTTAAQATSVLKILAYLPRVRTCLCPFHEDNLYIIPEARPNLSLFPFPWYPRRHASSVFLNSLLRAHPLITSHP